jgi:hypothetical protein
MSPGTFEVWLDEEHQVVCQRIAGAVDEPDFVTLTDATAACVARLRDPANVRILVDARKMIYGNAKGRRAGIAAFERPELKRLAMWGGGPMVRVLVSFFCIATGKKNMRAFATEQDALDWLTR